MKTTDKILDRINANVTDENLGAIDRAWHAIASRVPGWSSQLHYLFFKSVFEAAPEVKTVLILGVYMGRDITIMLDCAKGRALQVIGVDRFQDIPCDDWLAEKKTQTWEAAGFGAAPDVKKALGNISPVFPHEVRLVQSDSTAWLESVSGKFDFIYIDTSHDYETVKREIAGVRKLCHANTIIAGDDYVNEGKDWWGVDRAVTEAFVGHHVLRTMIWFAGADDLKP